MHGSAMHVSSQHMQPQASSEDHGVALKRFLHSWQVEWLREKIRDIPIRLVFESALELMGTTQLGGFKVCLHCDTRLPGMTLQSESSNAVVLSHGLGAL